jgi:ABC-2 type transport system ATP-binding protein
MTDHMRYLTGPLSKQMRPKIIEFCHVTVMQEAQIVLKDITLDVFEGESIALVGPPGSGKSALLACVQGLMQPTWGEITVLGASLPPIPPAVDRQIGVMPQQLEYKLTGTVAEHLQRFATYRGLSLNHLQLHAYAAQYQLALSTPVAQLTSLQARMLALALALVHDPRLVILDDPLKGLAEQNRADLWAALQKIQREGRTLLCTFTHPVADFSLNDYDIVARLEQGRLLRQET